MTRPVYQVVECPSLADHDYAIKDGRAINLHGLVRDVIELQTAVGELSDCLQDVVEVAHNYDAHDVISLEKPEALEKAEKLIDRWGWRA